MKTDLVAVLDLGASKATCLAATPDPQHGFKIQGVASVPCKGVRKGVLADLEEAGRSIDAAVRRVQQDVGQEIPSLVVGVSGGHVEGLNAQGFKPIVPRSRHITHQDVLEVINHSRSVVLPPDREQIQALPREFRVNGVRDVRKPIGMAGDKLEVVTYIVTGQTTQLQNLERAVGLANKKVEQMVLTPLASGVGVLTQEEMDLGVAVIDLGADTADLGIFVNGSIAYSATVPIGGGLVTSDICKLLKTTPEEAERMKVTYGVAYARMVNEKESVQVMQLGQTMARPMQRRVLGEIIESRMREVAVMIRQHIEKSGFMGVLPGGIVLTGGGAQLAGTDHLFEDQVKHMRVRVAEPSLPAKFDHPHQSGLAAAVGLARFSIQCYDEIAPAVGNQSWREKVKSLFSIVAGK